MGSVTSTFSPCFTLAGFGSASVMGAGAMLIVIGMVGSTALTLLLLAAAAASVTGLGAAADASPSATSSGVMAPASEVLVAHRTIYLRQARSRGAALEAVLEAGDTLAVDSLVGGWFRVTFEGAVMGYAERGSLDTLAARESS